MNDFTGKTLKNISKQCEQREIERGENRREKGWKNIRVFVMVFSNILETSLEY